MYEPKKVTIRNVRHNKNVPAVTKNLDIFNMSIKPNIYFFIMKDYHNFVYLITHHLNCMVKAQFRQIFDLSESQARYRFDTLVKMDEEEKKKKKKHEVAKNEEYYFLAKKFYKGSHCIFPISRAFSYSEINFLDEKKVRLDYNPKEQNMLRGVMKTEYWLKYKVLLVREFDFIPKFLPKEFDRVAPFDYHFSCFFWMIKELQEGTKSKRKYVRFRRKVKASQSIIDKEVPLIDSSFEERFKSASIEAKKAFVSKVTSAAFETLEKSDVYVTKVVPIEQGKGYFKPDYEFHIAIFHFPNTSASRYNHIITALQRIICFQWISVKLKIQVLAYSDKTRNEACYAWNQAVKRREERTDRVNLEKRAKKYFNYKEKKLKNVTMNITERTFQSYCKTSNLYCKVGEVEFVDLKVDRYFTHHISSMGEGFDPGDLESEE
jgi:hypothetical protein